MEKLRRASQLHTEYEILLNEVESIKSLAKKFSGKERAIELNFVHDTFENIRNYQNNLFTTLQESAEMDDEDELIDLPASKCSMDVFNVDNQEGLFVLQSLLKAKKQKLIALKKEIRELGLM